MTAPTASPTGGRLRTIWSHPATAVIVAAAVSVGAWLGDRPAVALFAAGAGAGISLSGSV